MSDLTAAEHQPIREGTGEVPSPPHWIDFGNELKSARLAASLTQRQLAEKIGLDHTYISHLEHARNPPPSTETINVIAGTLGVVRAVFDRHMWKAAPEDMPRSALEHRCAVLERAVRLIRDAPIHHEVFAVHHRAGDWHAFESMVDGNEGGQ